MTTVKPVKKKSAAQRLWFLHWLMAAFFLLLFIGGTYMANFLGDAPYRRLFYDFHKTLGVVVMSLLLARIVVLLAVLRHKYRYRKPKATREWWQSLILHSFLYGFMLFMPISGYMMSNAGNHDVVVFATPIVLPRLFPVDPQLGALGRNLHFWLGYTFLAAVFLHMAEQWRYLRSQWRRFRRKA
ncbi:cytochrome b [Calothrix sp. 336/3]|uniref:cytochrome b n=1 Tax=Calothrix sp. 336/3 TaxID=1337936 RepID=UPI0004E45E52|nr:cytochrome b/b6 domain-containing protein [Calothrix sp. 336/3]AKG20172.1 hypothetical protein IJ00_01595 [Calothrix sp. 336/3]